MRAALLLLACGCGVGGGDGGGSSSLPVSGAGPYAKIADPQRVTVLDEPYVVIDPNADVTDPAPLALGDGTIRVYYTRGGSEIWRSDLPASLTEPAGEPTLVLAGAAAPSVVPPSVGDGAAVHLYYERGGGITRATSTDGGASFTEDGVVLLNALQPGAARADGRTYLYFTRLDVDGEAIFVATSDDGLSFTEADAPVLGRRPGRFDGARIDQPAAVAEITEAGELHVGLFYAGTSSAGVTAIGYAGSYDGLHFSALTQAVLEPLTPNEHGPGAVLFPTRAVLFYSEDRAGRAAIAAATSP